MRSDITDEMLIQAWREHQSPSVVAQVLGLSVRAVFDRRDRLERKGITLPVADKRSRRHVVAKIEKHSAVVRSEIDNGVVLVGSDAHIWPGPRTTMQKAFVRFAKELKPKMVIANGDFCDFPAISRFPSLSWNDMSRKPSVKEELEAIGDYMGELAKAAPAAKRFWPFGNHDQRFEARLAAMAPDFVGVKGMSLKDHFPDWVPCWRIDLNDSVVIRHRELGGEHADFRNVQTQGASVITGHDHRTGVTPYRSYRGVHYGVRCGFLADGADDPQFVEYLEGREPNWHPAFAVLTFKDGRLLYPELCTKHDEGVVQFRGELISV